MVLSQAEVHLQSGVKEAADQIFHCALTACHQECSFLGGRTDSWTEETFSKGRQSELLNHNNILTQLWFQSRYLLRGIH